MTDRSECNNRDYSLIVEINGKTYLRADFDFIADVNALVIMPVVQMIKELYPEAKIIWKRCSEEPVFSFPLYQSLVGSSRPQTQRFM